MSKFSDGALIRASLQLNEASRELLVAFHKDHPGSRQIRVDRAIEQTNAALKLLDLATIPIKLLEQLQCLSNPQPPTADAPASTTSPTNAAEPTAPGSTSSDQSLSSDMPQGLLRPITST